MYRRVYALAGALETKFSFQRETDPDPDRSFIRVDVCNRSFTPQTACNLIGSDLGWTSPLPLTMIKVESAVVVAAHSDDWQNNVIQTVCVCVHFAVCARMKNDRMHARTFAWTRLLCKVAVCRRFVHAFVLACFWNVWGINEFRWLWSCVLFTISLALLLSLCWSAPSSVWQLWQLVRSTPHTRQSSPIQANKQLIISIHKQPTQREVRRRRRRRRRRARPRRRKGVSGFIWVQLWPHPLHTHTHTHISAHSYNVNSAVVTV